MKFISGIRGEKQAHLSKNVSRHPVLMELARLPVMGLIEE